MNNELKNIILKVNPPPDFIEDGADKREIIIDIGSGKNILNILGGLNKMTISRERVEELRDKLLLRLQADLEEIIHTTIEAAGKDPLDFLTRYTRGLKKHYREATGVVSIESYVHVNFPLSKSDFTEEELTYLKFYDED